MQEQSLQRRIRAERGIYYRSTAAGRRYEITFADSTGRQRWKVVPGGLREARLARAELTARTARGEQVLPPPARVVDVAAEWLATQSHLRAGTLERYETVLRRHVIPRLGQCQIAAIREEDLISLIAALRSEGLAAATINKTVMVLGRVLAYAARRRLIARNPVQHLSRNERPRVIRREMRVLDPEEVAALLLHSGRYRPLFATAIFTGLRLGELLGLTWGDIELRAGVVQVRKQLNRRGVRVAPKTAEAVREVVLMPALGRILRQHRVASPFCREAEPVFTSSVGTPMHHRNVSRRGLAIAAERARLNIQARPSLRFHDFRHTFASLLIAEGATVVFVSRQLGHASPATTLRFYAHLFDRAAHSERTRQALEDGYGKLLETVCGDGRRMA
jgi:integrase